MSVNKDKDVPRSEEAPRFDMSSQAFQCDPRGVHIFWGPNQLTTNYPEYTPPDEKGWKKEYLNIPKVGRFIYAVSDAYDSDDFPNDGGGGGHNQPYYKVQELVAKQPPFPTLYMVYTSYGLFGGSGITGSYSVTQSEFAQFSVGMSYSPPYSGSENGSLNYYEGAFHSRTSGAVVVPF